MPPRMKNPANASKVNRLRMTTAGGMLQLFFRWPVISSSGQWELHAAFLHVMLQRHVLFDGDARGEDRPAGQVSPYSRTYHARRMFRECVGPHEVTTRSGFHHAALHKQKKCAQVQPRKPMFPLCIPDDYNKCTYVKYRQNQFSTLHPT